MSATFENAPAAAAPPLAQAVRPSSLVSKLRLVFAILATVTLLPYAWGRTLVVYAQWNQIEQRFLFQLLAGIVAVIALNFHLASKFSSRKFSKAIFGAVFVLWAGVAAAMIVIYNGDALPHWLVFAGFFPATLWVFWTAWMFFIPIRWSVRLGVLAVLIVAVVPYLKLFEVSGLTGDTRVNFALRSRTTPDALIKSTVGELSSGGFKLVANSKTDFPAFQGPARTAVLPDVKLDRNWAEHPPREIWRVPIGAPVGAALPSSAVMPSRRSSAATTNALSAVGFRPDKRFGSMRTKRHSRTSRGTREWGGRDPAARRPLTTVAFTRSGPLESSTASTAGRDTSIGPATSSPKTAATWRSTAFAARR
jgi:hypothetical protein